jgi:hypothetical protein
MLCAADAVDAASAAGACAAAAAAALLIQGLVGMRGDRFDVNLLQLGFNCLRHDTAEDAALYIPRCGNLEPAIAQKLLTAVARQHTTLWGHLLVSPQEHIDAATCEKAFELGMMQEGSEVMQCMERMARHPAAAQLDADAAARLLLAAMKLSRFGVCPSAPEQLTAYAAASKHADLLLAALPQVLQQRKEAHSSAQHQPDGALVSPYHSCKCACCTYLSCRDQRGSAAMLPSCCCWKHCSYRDQAQALAYRDCAI